MLKKLKWIQFIVLLLICSSVSASFWEPPQIISGPGVIATTSDAVDIACDANGNVVAVWVQVLVSGDQAIMSAYRPAGGLWEAPVQLSKGTTNTEPKVCIDGNGTLTAVWINTADKQVESCYRLVGGVWTSIDVITSGGDYLHLAIDCIATGRVIAVWFDQTAPGAIAAAWRESTFVWQAANKLHDTLGPTAYPQVQFQPNNSATVVFYSSADQMMYYNQETFGGTWSAAVAFTGLLTGYQKRHDLALNDSGNGVVALMADVGGGGLIEVGTKLFVGGIPFTTPLTDISLGIGVGVDRGPRVAVDNNGIATVVWSSNAANKDVYSGVTTVNATPSNLWSVVSIFPGSGIGAGEILPAVAASPNGGLVTQWFTNTAASAYEPTLKTGFGGVFEPDPVFISIDSKGGDVCISNNGVAFAAWLRSIGGTSYIEATQSIPGGNLIQGVEGAKRVIFQRGILH